MKKTLIIGLITMLSLCLTYGFANAAASGACVLCHTMHNSQDGTSMRFDGNPAPIEKLLRGDCLGCHAKPGASSGIVDGIPQVYQTGTDLAGGNFEHGTTSQAMVHNVSGLGLGMDSILSNNPPGYDAGYDPSTGGWQTSSRLVCAGQQGCHGDRDEVNEWTAVSGGHHGDDSMLKFGTMDTSSQGVDVPSSYRFLLGVHGGENTDWAWLSVTNHNEHSGEALAAARSTQGWGDIDTISNLCAECHGQFHASADITNFTTTGPWLRHPTDYVLPNSGEYASITSDYHLDAPVGRNDTRLDALSAPDSTISLSLDIVTCLSCHKAHGSENPDILRWNYTSTLAAGTGCLYCHTGKLAY